jgi:hypothetical protein
MPWRHAYSASLRISYLTVKPALEAPLLIRVSAEFVRATAALEAFNMGLQKESVRAPGTRQPFASGSRDSALTEQIGSLERLMQFFPQGSRVRIPVGVSRAFSPESTNTVIEYGTAREVIFRFPLPLEFGERVRLASRDGLLNTEAEILAVQLSQSETLVAARFTGEVSNWIIKA